MEKEIELPSQNALPVLPLRDIVVFPNMIVPLFVGRDKSVKALEEVMKNDQRILLLTQKDAAMEDPKAKDLYTMGTVAQVLQLLKLPDGTVKVLVEGEERAHVIKLSQSKTFFTADIEIMRSEDASEYASDDLSEDQEKDSPDSIDKKTGAEAHMRTALSVFEQYLKLNPKIPPESLASVTKIDTPHRLADTLASHLTIKVQDKQNLLEIIDPVDRLEAISALMDGEISVLQAEKRHKTV